MTGNEQFFISLFIVSLLTTSPVLSQSKLCGHNNLIKLVIKLTNGMFAVLCAISAFYNQFKKTV
jgi:hypothetical protein